MLVELPEILQKSRHFRYVVGVFAFICFTSAISAMTGFGPLGYVGQFMSRLENYLPTITDPVLFWLLRIFAIPPEVVFFLGVVAAYAVLLAFILVLFIPYLVLSMCVMLAKVSIVGALVVFVVSGIIIAALLRKYWEAVIVAFAWLVELLTGIGTWFRVPEQRMNDRHIHTDNSALIVKTGEIVMPPRDSQLPSVPARGNALPPTDGPKTDPFTAPVPASLFSAYRREIRSKATAKALKTEAEMVRNAADLGRAHMSVYDVETDWNNKGMVREEKTIRQAISLTKAEQELDDLKAQQEFKRRVPNPVDQKFETQYKPLVENEYRADVLERVSSARAAIETLKHLTALEREIEESECSPEDKAMIKQKLRQDFEPYLNQPDPRQRSASAGSNEK